MICMKTFLNATLVESSVNKSDCATGELRSQVGEESRIASLANMRSCACARVIAIDRFRFGALSVLKSDIAPRPH